MFQRRLTLPLNPTESFFLWGPRQTGKSTLLRKTYPDSLWFDLLDSDLFVSLSKRPALFREIVLGFEKTGPVVIDEIQKIPALLDEIHRLIESDGKVFAMCGSSARKVRKGHANLLGGRARRFELSGLVSAELGTEFELTRILNTGYLPRHISNKEPEQAIRSYVNDYLKEEIAAEGISRNLGVFSDFLRAAAFSDGEQVNFSNIARECGVSAPTVRGYFDVLCDTLWGNFCQAFQKRPSRRITVSPKFYFADVAVVNYLCKRGKIQPGSELYGKAFENWLYHELLAAYQYRNRDPEITFWRTTTQTEVDFILGDGEIAVEAKSTEEVRSDHLKPLREFAKDHPQVKRRIVVSRDKFPRKTEDNIEILPYAHFVNKLWNGAEIIP